MSASASLGRARVCRVGIVLMVLGVLAAPFFARADVPSPAYAADAPLALGVLAFRPVAETTERWQPLASYLSQSLDGRPVRLVVANYATFLGHLARDELDFVLTNPSHYIELRSGNALSGALATMIVEEDGHQLTGFGGVIMTRAARTDINALGDLRGKKVAAIAEGSLGAYRAQAMELRDIGIRAERDLSLLFVGSPHDKVVEAVMDGRADAGFVRTGILEAMAREGRLDPARVKVIAPRTRPGFPFQLSTRLYPEWPFVALPHVDKKVARRVAAALLSFEPDAKTRARMEIVGFGVPADYAPVEDMARTLRLPPYQAAPEFGAADVWAQYRLSIVGGVVVLVVMGGLAVWLVSVNRKLRSTQTQLDAERARLASIIWGTDVGTWEWNVQTGETRFNERWAGIIGRTLDELSPVDINTWMEHAHPEDLERSGDALRRHFAGEIDHYECEARMRHKDGRWIWVLDRGRVVEWTADGKPLWMAGTHIDITARKEAQNAERAREERFRILFENAAVSVMVHDRDSFEILEANRTALKSYAVADVDELRQWNIWCEPPYSRDDAAPWFARALTEGPQRFEWKSRNAKGQEFWEEVNLQTIEWRGVPRFVSIAVDITARKWAETELRRLNQRLDMILNSAREGIYGLDREGRTIFANQAASEMLGWTVEEMLGRNQHDLIHHTKEDGGHYHIEDCPIYRSQKDARVYEVGNEVFWRKDGTSFPVEYVASPVIDADGNIVGGMVVFRNVSERTTLMRELERSNAELEQFAYVVSHDLRQPLRMINSYGQLLERRLGDALDADGREFMGFIKDGAVRMDRMLVSLLEYSRVGRKGQPMAEVDARAVLDDALLYLKPDIDEAKAEIAVTGTWPTVSASRDELVRLFQNLIGNAVKYRAKGARPKINVSVKKARGEWVFSVRDNGIGIAPEHFDRLFLVFQRLHGPKEYEGTGIGLAICRRIVERHGGRIRVASEGEGKGATFTFTLPVAGKKG